MQNDQIACFKMRIKCRQWDNALMECHLEPEYPSFINAVFFQTMSNITKLQFLRICITTKNCLSTDIIPFFIVLILLRWISRRSLKDGKYYNITIFKFKFYRHFPKGSKRFQKFLIINKQINKFWSISVQDIWWRCNKQKRIIMSHFWK